ncbi:MAG: hypothetical protein IJ081_06575 [Prevotella sp.]|nr:hypothetical protein [Prevotella sp.]
MKKYYFFAALATVGLFASCSSDEDFNDAADARQAINAVDDNTPAKIEIGLADNVEVSRGTGRVGGAGDANAQWAGQSFNVLMLEKGTMMGARLTPNDPTTAILKGTAMTATGVTVVSLDPEARYYPNYKQDGVSAGVYDFWGYRLDNSETPNAGTPVFKGYDVAAADASYTWGAAQTDEPANVDAGDIAELNAAPTTTTIGVAEKWYKYTDNNDTPDDTTDDVVKYVQCTAVSAASAAANQITVPFKIDGTQDIMIAVTNPSDAAYATANAAAIYSAKSARNGVKPTMAFKHLLTSLTFKVKPKSRDISNQASKPITGNGAWEAGYQITNITLKSKATGELIVAYTPDNVVADENRIIWADDQNWANPTSLTAFQLQCRPKAIANKADIKMVAVRSDAQAGFVINYANGYESAAGVTSYTVGADLLTMTVYDSGEVYDGDNETGLPKGNATTLQAMKDAHPNAAFVTGYIRTYKQGNRTPHATTQNFNECDYSANAAGVTENLAPFYDNAEVYKTVLNWEGYTAGSAAHTDWVASDATEYDAAGTNAIDTYAAVAYDAATHDVLLDQANDGKIYNFNGVYKKVVYTSAVAPSNGNAVAQQIGEPMLVAPSNDDANSGYQVVVTYKYWKKKAADRADLTEVDSKPITVNNYTIDPASGNKIPGAFEAGKNYNVTITLYSDGEVLNGDATSEPWDDGGDLEAGDDE